MSFAVAVLALPQPRSDFIDLGASRLELVKIPAGAFRMGSDAVIRARDDWQLCAACPARNEAERPAHQVTITRDYWMGKFPVTQHQWQEVVGTNPSRIKSAGPDAPVETVSWKEVNNF